MKKKILSQEIDKVYNRTQEFIEKNYFDCLGVCLKPINVKTAEPFRPKFWMGPHDPGECFKIGKKSWKIVGIFLKMRQFEKKNPQKL